MVGLAPAALSGQSRRACSLRLRIAVLTLGLSVLARGADTQKPALVSYVYSPMAIDTAQAAQVVSASVTATDDEAGLDYALIAFESPTKMRRVDCLSARGGVSSGSSLNGGFSCQATFPRYSETGDWAVAFVQVGDKAGNVKTVVASELAAGGLATKLTVQGVADLAAPGLTGYQYSPQYADTSSAATVILGMVTATDELAGVQGVVLAFYSPTGNRRVDCVSGAAPASGTVRSGVWNCSGTLPRYSETGDWVVRFAEVRDQAGNVLRLETAALTGRGQATKLTVSGVADTAAPAVVGYTLSTAEIDTSQAAQTVSGTIQVSDNLSGVNVAALAFYSASGNQRVDCSSGGSGPVSGNALAGVYACTAVFPAKAEAGMWSVRFAEVTDKAGNVTRLTTAELTARGLQVSVSNQGEGGPAVSPGRLSFVGKAYGAATAWQSVALSSISGVAAYTVSIPTSAASWLSVNSAQGVTPATLSFRADPKSLGAGVYGASVEVAVSGWSQKAKVEVVLVVRASGDLDGNDKADFLWQNDETRGVTIWFMGGAEGRSNIAWEWLLGGAAGWRVKATGDFDRNGVPDLIWQEDSTRAVTIWYMGGARGDELLGWMYLHGGATGWQIMGVGDFDRNGTPDVIWQNDESRAVTVWYMGGTLGNVLLGWMYLHGGAPGWAIVGVGDIDRNGTPDVLWQEDTTGMVTLWYMGGEMGNVLLQWVIVHSGAKGWRVRGATDLDSNGTPDLVWQSEQAGDVTIWYLGGANGGTMLSWSYLIMGASGWRILVPN